MEGESLTICCVTVLIEDVATCDRRLGLMEWKIIFIGNNDLANDRLRINNNVLNIIFVQLADMKVGLCHTPIGTLGIPPSGLFVYHHYKLLCLHFMAQLSLDNKILEMRLLYKDSVISMPSITKCAKQLNLYQKNMKDIAVLEGFLNESLSCKLEIEKTMKIFEMLEEQEKEYDELESVIQSNIHETKNKIISLEEELKQQLLIREGVPGRDANQP